MPSTQEHQISRNGDGWLLSCGPTSAVASEVTRKSDGSVVARLVVSGEQGIAFTDSKVNLTSSKDRSRISRQVQKAGAAISETGLMALEQVLQQASTFGESSSAIEGDGKRKASILDEAPLTLSRPLSIVGDHAYAAIRLHIDTQDEPVLVVVREDGALFSSASIEGGEALETLGFSIKAQVGVIPNSHAWSGRGVRAYNKGYRPDPADVFRRIVAVINHHVSFVRSIDDHHTMCEMVALYLLHTWLLDAFNVAGYLWFGGEKGSGKSTALKVGCEVGFLGLVLTASSSLPALRDLSDCGSLLGLDDAEQLTNPKDMDAGKLELLLSGNRRGACTIIKEPSPTGKTWAVRHVSIFSPRLFSAIGTPPAALASRTIRVPMCRTNANMVGDPADHGQWPTSRRQLIDDLWALSLSRLREVRSVDPQLPKHTDLVGRALEPWRGVLTMALWLQEDHGVGGLLERMTAASLKYQKEREDLEAEDPARIAIRCVGDMLDDHVGAEPLIFTTADLVSRMNVLGKELEIIEEGREFDVRRVGRLLARLRFARPVNMPGKKRWQITRAMYRTLATEHGISRLGDDTDAIPAAATRSPDGMLDAEF